MSTLAPLFIPPALAAVTIALAIAAGVHRVANVLGPPRAGAGDRPRLFTAASIGLFAYLVAGILVAKIIQPSSITTTAPASTQAVAPTLPPQLLGLLGIASPLAGVLALLYVDRFLRRSPDPSPPFPRTPPFRAAGVGLLGLLIAYPLLFAVASATQTVLEHLGIQHPAAHPVLEAMSAGGLPVIALLIMSAVVAAPLFEELFFRGFIQTLLVVPGWSSPLRRCAAIAGTSLLFMAVHPWWTWPAIFTLSLALGYVYERTGSLWAPLAAHVAFNAVSITLFLVGVGG